MTTVHKQFSINQRNRSQLIKLDVLENSYAVKNSFCDVDKDFLSMEDDFRSVSAWRERFEYLHDRYGGKGFCECPRCSAK